MGTSEESSRAGILGLGLKGRFEVLTSYAPLLSLKYMVKRRGQKTARGIDGKIERKIDNLTAMAQREFSSLNKKMTELRNEILEMKSDLEDIKLRMGNMAFRFEIQDLERRLKRVELKVGLGR